MFNVFSRAQVVAASIEHTVVQSALGCCVDRISRGVFAVVAECGHGRHRRLQYFLEDTSLLPARPGSRQTSQPANSKAHQAKAVTRWERERLWHIGWLECSTRVMETDIISHRSAAMVHALPLMPGRLTAIEVSSPLAKGTTAALRRRQRDIADVDVMSEETAFGFTVTTRERTTADLMRDCGWQTGIMAAEALIGTPMTNAAGRRVKFPLPPELREKRKEALAAAVDRLPGTRSTQRMKNILDYSSGLSESPAESLTVLGLHHVGIDDYVQQAELYAADGTFLGRVDFLIERLQLVIEVDGEGKYLAQPDGRLIDPETFKREKKRENNIRSLGYRVVRVEWKDVVEPARFAAALRRAGVIR